MNIEDLRKLSPADAINKAAEFVGVPATVIDGIWRTESGRGANKLSAAGAQGDFQIMPGTQKLLENKLGMKFNAMDFYDSLYMSMHHLKDDFKREGNIPDMLRAYNAGPNRKRWSNPETQAYASKVLGTDDAPEANVPTKAIPQPITLQTGMPALPTRKGDDRGMPKTATAMAAASFLDSILADKAPKQDRFAQEVASSVTADAAVEAERQNTGFIDTARAAFMHQGVIGGILNRVSRDEYQEEPGFTVSEQDLVGYTADQQRFLQDARSSAEFARYKWELDTEKEDMRIAGLSGPLYQFAASTFAGFPEGVVSGLGVAKAMSVAGYGSIQAARAGEAGRAIMLNVAENVGGNLLTTTAEDAISGRMSVYDYGIAATAGLLFSGLGVRGLQRQSYEAIAAAAQKQAIEKQIAVFHEAQGRLGPNATKEELHAEMARIEARQLADDQNAATGALPTDRKLLSDDTNAALHDEVPQVKDEQGAPMTDATPEATMATKAADQPNYSSAEQAERMRSHYIQDPAYMANTVVADGNIGTLNRVREEIRKFFDEQPEKGGIYMHNVPAEHHALIEWLHGKFMADTKLVFAFDNYTTHGQMGEGVLGDAGFIGRQLHRIRINNNAKSGFVPGRMDVESTIIHEFGHAIWQQHFTRVSTAKQAKLQADYDRWRTSYIDGGGQSNKALLFERSSLVQSVSTRNRLLGQSADDGSLFEVMAGAVLYGEKTGGADNAKYASYWGNFEEMSAEQFSKYIQSVVENERFASVPKSLKDYFTDLIKAIQKVWQDMKNHGKLEAMPSFTDFFETVYKMHKAAATKDKIAASGNAYPQRRNANPVTEPMIVTEQSMTGGDVVALKYGLDLMPEGTPAQRAEKRAMVELYTRAANPEAPWNKLDEKALQRMTDNGVVNVASSGLLLMKSGNPVARMVSYELLESTTGAAGRTTTASLAKFLNERKFVGNVINDLQTNYSQWAKANGVNMWQTWGRGDAWQRYNLQIAEHIESLRAGQAGSDNPIIVRAAASVQAAYERMRVAQIQARTLGFGALPETSVGYMPHRMSSHKLRNITPQQERAVWSALVDQFISVEGWDIDFSSNLASKYLDNIRSRANGGYNAPLGAHDVGASDLIRQAMEAMGMDEQTIAMNLERFSRGGPSHTKARLNLDLLAAHELEDGSTFRLIDLYETDQLALIRQQAQRVSGEVALARHGIMGRPGLKVLRKSFDFGDAKSKVQPKEVEAFDQIAAEFLGDPFGTHGGKWMDRALQLNSLSRLGGMGITQFSEYINMAAHLGVAKTMKAIAALPRLRKEAVTLANGGQVDSILTSLERVGGAEFGADSYKMVFPFDNPDMPYQVNGHDTTFLADRLLRGGVHAQAKLSGWRAIHSAQQRGVAEQIIHKAMKYIRDDKYSVALNDMGFTPDIARKIKAQMVSAVKFEGDRVVSFDVTKFDAQTANEIIQAVHRGAGQIIQGTYIGETGKWAHEGWLKLMSQFRTFSITSVEKQWGRQVKNHGVVTALMMLMGTMSVAIPLHYARVYAASIGRPDQQEYLDKRLSVEALARASLNYTAMSGLSGDFIDALSAISGVGQPEGGRHGGGTNFVGTVVAPAAGMADDLWKALQNTRDGTDPHDLIKNSPFSKLPYLLPAINALD